MSIVKEMNDDQMYRIELGSYHGLKPAVILRFLFQVGDQEEWKQLGRQGTGEGVALCLP